MLLTQEQIKQIVQDYFKDKPVKTAFLFGSYAKGDAKETSDVDIILELDYSKKIGLEFVRWMYDLEQQFGRKADLVPEDSMYESIKADADKSKILLLRKQAA
ncbi:MAG: nucleotidyltransferase domain-containing protein [Chitinophagaceae bacterium]|nr:nucleotidyltransferase domain-containing protein [Chitinophagaceae bacterium]